MNKRLDQALTQVKSLSEDEQDAVADVLFDYLDGQKRDLELTPEQEAEVRRRMADPHYASDQDVKAFFDRLSK